MKFSLQATIWAGIVFSIACLAFAITGFISLAGLAALAWWMVRGMREPLDP